MIKWSEYDDVWRKVKRSARTTIHREGSGIYPTTEWKKSILLAEHSPIRKIKFSWKWANLKSWVSVHFVRHWLGIEHWVTTQRSDRTGVKRDKLPQDAFVEHECEANAQALINISRKRLCNQASPETRKAWEEVIKEVRRHDSVLASVCQPECIYRGFCPEMYPCGYAETEEYRERLAKYRDRKAGYELCMSCSKNFELCDSHDGEYCLENGTITSCQKYEEFDD